MWKYESGEYRYVSLHDNVVNSVYVDENDIILMFSDGFDIIEAHPLNNTKKSKHTSQSQIVLKNAQYLYGSVCCYSQERQAIDFCALLGQSVDFLILQFWVENTTVRFLAMLNTDKYRNEFFEIVFSCSDLVFCWNDYSSDAWFDGWP